MRNDIRNAPVFFPDLIKTIMTNSKIQEYIARFFIKDQIEKYLLIYNNTVYYINLTFLFMIIRCFIVRRTMKTLVQ